MTATNLSPRIDLVSNTATRPTAELRAAMAVAPVGDEQRDIESHETDLYLNPRRRNY